MALEVYGQELESMEEGDCSKVQARYIWYWRFAIDIKETHGMGLWKKIHSGKEIFQTCIKKLEQGRG